jgi:hypothetical protein
MGVNLEDIKNWLTQKNKEYKVNSDGVISFFDGNNYSVLQYNIFSVDDGNIFEMQMYFLDKKLENFAIKYQEHTAKVLQHILYLNYKTKFGTWEYNPHNGEIRLEVEVPLADAIITKNQFDMIYNYMIHQGLSHVEEIKFILEHGRLNKEQTNEELLAFLEMLKKELGK